MLRAFSAGIVWGIVALFIQLNSASGTDGEGWFLFPLVALFVYPFVLLSFLIFGKIMTTFVGGIGELTFAIMAFFTGLALAVGDPLVYLLHKKKPELVPVEDFAFINPILFLAVLKPEIPGSMQPVPI